MDLSEATLRDITNELGKRFSCAVIGIYTKTRIHEGELDQVVKTFDIGDKLLCLAVSDTIRDRLSAEIRDFGYPPYDI